MLTRDGTFLLLFFISCRELNNALITVFSASFQLLLKYNTDSWGGGGNEVKERDRK